ncbi:hypothetical protein QYE76_056711 [Lolium multiflorum]|uniref:CCHC-type domain-containing protein n=1 Tax=Lolium multiflorum TaxID=4521 RepID=A0AAD8T2M2_LOLMU|nr:hypothetical protein QYE76_056711 [Lolium multiflorum]
MTNAEMHAHFTHLLGGHATDVDGRLGDVDAKLTDALDKIDGLEAAFNSKLDAKFQELLTRLPPPRANVQRRARRVPRADVPAGTAAAAAAAHDAPSDEGYEDYGGNEDEQVDENVLDDEEVQQPAPGRPRQLNRHARPPPRPDRQPPWRKANVSAGRTSSWTPRQSAPQSRGTTPAPSTSKYTAPASRAPPAATPPPSAGPPRSSSSMASTGKTRDIQCRKCLGFGHIERECRTKRVMLVREDGEYDSASDFDEDTLALIAARDGANSDSEREMEVMEADTADQYRSLVAQRVLSVQLSKAEHDQRHNLFQTRGVVKERAIRIIIDGGSCNNLASVDMVEKLSLPTRQRTHPYYIQWFESSRKLKEFIDVFPQDVPPGLPPIRGIEHQIDLIPDMASSINFNQFLEKEKLKSNGSNFTDWFRHVRIFLNGGNLQYVLDAPLGDPPAETETDEVKNVYATRKTRYSQVQCAILCSLEADLQKRFEHHDPHELINELKTIFETHAAVECYEASKHFFSCMMEEGSSVSEHMLAMTGHAKKLSDLGIVIPNRLGINRVLQSLPPSYKNFVMNYNMQNMNKELPELFAMLKSAEIEIKKEHQVLMVNKTTSFKKQGKSKGKNKKSGKKAATPPVKPKTGPKPDAECYYCKEKGHWKRNCSKYLADLKSGLVKKKKEGISDIHVIDVYLTGSRTSTWVFDTGSVAHICNSKQELKNKRRLLKDEVTMRVGNGSKVDVIVVGTLPLHLPSGLVLSLNNCYFVPALSMNIISGSCLMQDGYSFKSENNGCSIFMNNIFYGRAPEKNGLFLLDLDSSDTHIHNIDAKRIKLNDNSTYMWHCRLGHIGVKRMKKLHTDGLLESLDFESLDRCEACLMGKMTKTPFSGIMERATDLLEIIHTDVCGPMSVASRGGYRYVLTFTDDLSRYGYIYFMKHKSETFEKFKEFQSEVENQQTAAFTLNRAPSKSVETTPYELWFNKKPKMSFLKVWGCEAYVKKLQPDKLEPKAEKCVFIGYPKETIGYTFYHRSEGKIFVAKNGTFLEKEFLTKEVTGRKVELDEIEESLLVDQSSAVPEDVPVPPTPATEEANDNDHETSNEIATEPRRSTRERATPDWYDPCLNVMIVDNNDEDPATYEEAMMSPDSNKWQEAMKSEMGSMYDNKVWTLVDLPDSRKAVENKWIFKRKTDADGNITVYKARLVAKGFRQIQGVDYDETFSPVAKLKSVRILLAIAAFFDYEIWQMDVKTAFLNGDIEEELYMVQPKGFVDPKNADKVCKLQRSIYGLKQASRSWNRRFDKVIKDFGFIQCHGEACIYKKVSGSSVAFLILYVDDILLIGNDIELLSTSYILGIKIYRDRSRRLIGLSQSTYLDKILKKFRMDESKKGFLPMLPGKVLSKTQGPATAEERERMSQIPYASAVGSIMYAMLCTRPDIAHAISLTSRYQSDPGMEHWTAVKNILKYLKRTKDMFLCYGGDQELVVTSYTDASWNTDPDDSKSQSGKPIRVAGIPGVAPHHISRPSTFNVLLGSSWFDSTLVSF